MLTEKWMKKLTQHLCQFLAFCYLSHTVNPVLSGHSKIYKTKVLMEYDSLMKVENIADCAFWNTFDLN